MKRTSKHNAGFTLVELVVAIAMATLITAAAASVLLMGMRINRQTGHTASQQMTVRTLLTTIEGIVAEGNVSDVEMNTKSWKIKEKKVEDEPRVLLSYLYDDTTKVGTVYVGDYQDTSATPVLTGLLSSYVELYDGLFTIHVETDDGMYSSSVYCRSLHSGAGDVGGSDYTGSEAGRKAFIALLKSQDISKGKIIYPDGYVKKEGDYSYYSEWYIKGFKNGWNPKTPWCACFISWALAQSEMAPYLKTVPRYADVDKFMRHFTEAALTADEDWMPGGGTPQGGDLIFFSWTGSKNPQHVGVVIKVEDGKVYTIEGNVNGRVAYRSYDLNDKRIIGYGILPWK